MSAENRARLAKAVAQLRQQCQPNAKRTAVLALCSFSYRAQVDEAYRRQLDAAWARVRPFLPPLTLEQRAEVAELKKWVRAMLKPEAARERGAIQ